ncbi:MAG: DUF6057 family protein [Parabacteroides sp.]
MKYKIAAFWIVVFGALFAFLEMNFRFHFFYIEQDQLFQSTWSYWVDCIRQPGGLTLWVSEFFVQFFILPYSGPLIVAVFLTLTGWMIGEIIRRIAPISEAFLLPLLPVIMLMFIELDFNYRFWGTVSFCMAVAAAWLYVMIRDKRIRIGYGIVFTPILYGLAGPVAILFAVMVSCYELLSRTSKGYWILLSCILVFFCAILSLYFSLTGEYRFAFLPDAYFHRGLVPKHVIYFSWIALIFVYVCAFVLCRRKNLSKMPRRITEAVLQVVVIAFILHWGLPKYSDTKSAKLKELDYYARMEQWNKIIDSCSGRLTNYLYMCYLNIALQQKGELLSKMFDYDQHGPTGLHVGWNKSEQISSLLSDVYFAAGYMSPAQEMAFESYISAMGYGNPRMLKRLVQTNLIYGAYPVAEKYIRILENTFYYKEWAKSQRKFLNNDAAVAADPVLGPRRKSLPPEDMSNLAQVNGGFESDMRLMTDVNPSYKAPFEFLAAFYLLVKDMDNLKALVEKYRGTPVMPTVPVYLQEALIAVAEQHSENWHQIGISEEVIQRFMIYKNAVLEGRNNPSELPGLLYNSFGNTYWFYFMFK